MAELPSGAVTFLFTDIEGSTQLVRRLRDRYAEVLAEHQRLLREAFARHGGHEIDTQGDAFFIAFSSAREAVLAAIEAQRALSGYPWPEDADVRVRMGIHTGQAAPVNGRYTGLAVHRAARICAAGHGGQLLVSQATQSLLEDEEEDMAVRLRDLGEQRLKDIDRPVRVYQVAAAGLPSEFPRLRHEAEAREMPPARPAYRRPVVVAGALAAVGLAAALVAFVLLRDDGGGLAGIRANHVGLIDTATGEIVAEVPVGLRPGPVAAGAGAIWVGNTDDRTLTRLDPATRAPAATITLDQQTPTGIAIGEGAAWVAHGRVGTLSRVDPQFNSVSETLELAEPSDAGAVALGEGAVWAVFGDSTLVRIDPATGSTGTSFAGTRAAGVAVGAGFVWVANAGDASVYKYSPRTFESGPIDEIPVGRRPNAIAFWFGGIWVANAGQDTISRLDPATGGQSTIPVGAAPSAIAVGGNALWVANESDGTVSRIDPATDEVTDVIDVGNVPVGLAVEGDYVWVAVQES